MFEKLPSLLGFQPKFYVGGPIRSYLPLLYDLVACRKPKSIVTVGFGDGEAFFAFCQAAREQSVDCRCLAVRRERRFTISQSIGSHPHTPYSEKARLLNGS